MLKDQRHFHASNAEERVAFDEANDPVRIFQERQLFRDKWP